MAFAVPVLLGAGGLLAADEVLNDGRGFDSIQAEWGRAWDGLQDGWADTWEAIKENPEALFVAAVAGGLTGGAGFVGGLSSFSVTGAAVGVASTAVSLGNDGIIGDLASVGGLFYGNYQQGIATNLAGRTTSELLVSASVRTVSDVAARELADKIIEESGLNPALAPIFAHSFSDGFVGGFDNFDGNLREAIVEGIQDSGSSLTTALQQGVKNELINNALQELDLPKGLDIALNTTFRTVLEELDGLHVRSIRDILEANKDQIIDDIVDELVSEVALQPLLDRLGLESLPPNIKNVFSDALSEGFVDNLEVLYDQYDGNIDQIIGHVGNSFNTGFDFVNDVSQVRENFSEFHNDLKGLIIDEINQDPYLATGVASDLVGLLNFSGHAEDALTTTVTRLINLARVDDEKSIRDILKDNKDEITHGVVEGFLSSHAIEPLLEELGVDVLPPHILQSLNNTVSNVLTDQAIELYDEHNGDFSAIIADITGRGENNAAAGTNGGSNADNPSYADQARDFFSTLPDRLRDSLREELNDDEAVVGIVTDVVQELGVSKGLSEILIVSLSTAGIESRDNYEGTIQSVRESVMQSGGVVIENLLTLGSRNFIDNLTENLNISPETLTILQQGLAPTLLKPIEAITNGEGIQQALASGQEGFYNDIMQALNENTEGAVSFIDQVILELDPVDDATSIAELTAIKDRIEFPTTDSLDPASVIFAGVEDYRDNIIDSLPNDIAQQIANDAQENSEALDVARNVENFTTVVGEQLPDSPEIVDDLTQQYESYIETGMDINPGEFAQIAAAIQINQEIIEPIMRELRRSVRQDEDPLILPASEFVESSEFFDMLRNDPEGLNAYLDEAVERAKTANRDSDEFYDAINAIKETVGYLDELDTKMLPQFNNNSLDLAYDIIRAEQGIDEIEALGGYASSHSYLGHYQSIARDIIDLYDGRDDILSAEQQAHYTAALTLVEVYDGREASTTYPEIGDAHDTLVQPLLDANQNIVEEQAQSEQVALSATVPGTEQNLDALNQWYQDAQGPIVPSDNSEGVDESVPSEVIVVSDDGTITTQVQEPDIVEPETPVVAEVTPEETLTESFEAAAENNTPNIVALTKVLDEAKDRVSKAGVAVYEASIQDEGYSEQAELEARQAQVIAINEQIEAERNLFEATKQDGNSLAITQLNASLDQTETKIASLTSEEVPTPNSSNTMQVVDNTIYDESREPVISMAEVDIPKSTQQLGKPDELVASNVSFQELVDFSKEGITEGIHDSFNLVSGIIVTLPDGRDITFQVDVPKNEIGDGLNGTSNMMAHFDGGQEFTDVMQSVQVGVELETPTGKEPAIDSTLNNNTLA